MSDQPTPPPRQLPPVDRLLRRVQRELRAGTPRHEVHCDLESARWRRQYGGPACTRVQTLLRRGDL